MTLMLSGFFRRRRRFLIRLLSAVAVLAILGWVAAWYVERAGWRFFNAGKAVTLELDRLAEAVAAGDAEALEARLSPAYAGYLLGLPGASGALPGPLSHRDGVEILPFVAGGPADREAAVAEWRAYLGGFAEVEEARFHVHRLEAWGGAGDPVVASVRFELVGTPAGWPRSGIDRGWLRMRFEPGTDGLLAASAELITGDPELPSWRIIAREPHFVDVAPTAGVGFENRYYPPFLEEGLRFGMIRHGPAGITAADVDNDGFYDLFIPDGVEARLFRNQGDGTFVDVTEQAGLSGLSGVSVGLFADYDNDGHKDLFASRTFEPNQLFHNDGDGTFTEVTEAAGIGADCCTTVASWADVDLDGDLDLYVGRYLDPRIKIPTTFYARNGEPDQLYRNEGDGTFTNITGASGIAETGLCLGSAFGDYDDDGDPDLYVANDFGRKSLYRNEGDGTFADVTVATGTLAYGAGMSSSFGDYDNDGRLDLYVAHIRSEHAWFAAAPTVGRYMLNSWRQGVWKTDMPLYWEIFRQSGFDFVGVFQEMASGNTLLRNRGDGTFEDTTWAARANPPGWFWGSGFADFDNDGWQDIYAANGWVYDEEATEIELDFLNNVVSKQDEYKTGAFFDPDNFGGLSWHGYERNRHLRNNGDGTFTEIGRAAGSDLELNSRGIAVADFWNRGALDIAVAASAARHALLRNQLAGRRHWLQVEVVGGGPDLPLGTNRDGVGVRVTAKVGGMTLTREVALGDGYGSQSMLRLHFGLGEARRVDELAVLWPRSGERQVFRSVGADRIVEVREGRSDLVEKRYPPPGDGG